MVWDSHRQQSKEDSPWVKRPGALPSHQWVTWVKAPDSFAPPQFIAITVFCLVSLPEWAWQLSDDTCSKVSSKTGSKNVRCCWYLFEAVVSGAQVSSALTPTRLPPAITTFS